MVRRFSRFFVGALLVIPVGLVSTPSAHAAAPTDLTYACANKQGVLRYTTGPGTCGKNETLVTFSVTAPTPVCALADGSVRKVAATNNCIKKPQGTRLDIPSNTPAHFCVNLSMKGKLRYVTDPASCNSDETLFVAVNHAPTDISLSGTSVEENVPSGTLVGTLSATDANADDSHSFSLVSGTGDTDNAAFTISGDELRTAAAVDFETQPSYSIRVATIDLLGLSYEEVFTITVDDIVESSAPTDIALSNATVAENQPAGTNIGTLTTTDPDAGDTHTYSLVSDGVTPNDNGSFQLSGSSLQTATPLDHEGTGPTYTVTIQTDDGNGGTFIESFTITATDANDAPTDISLSNNTVAENAPVGTAVGNLSASDQDAGDTHTFSLVSGSGDGDNAKFQIDGNTLETNAVLDFEDQSSFTVRVRADDGNGGSFERSFTLTADDANDPPTDITLSPDSVSEGEPSGTTIGTLSASDPDFGDTHLFTLVAGTGDEDNAKVTIDGTTLKTAAVIDSGTDPTLKVRVRADDGNGGTFEEALTVTVVNVNTGPTQIDLSNSSVAENQASGTAVGTLTCVDDPGDTHTFTLVSGTGSDDNGAFTIVGDQLQTNAVFDFEADASKTVRVRCEDQSNASFEQVFLITVTDANDAPTDIALSNASVDENQPSATTVGTLSATDPDAADTHSFSLVSGTGDTDNASFQIVGNTLKTNAVFNFEVQNSYSIRVRVTDSGGGTFEEIFTISVNNINDAPTAVDDSYDGAIGNTEALAGGAAVGPHVELAGNLPLHNDSDEDGDSLFTIAETVTTEWEGTAIIDESGGFVFRPGLGVRSVFDTFQYQVSDGTLTSTATVTVGITADVVWYMSWTENGDGRSHSPMFGPSSISGAGDLDQPGDTIFVYSGNYSGDLPLETLQTLYGEPAGLTIRGNVLVAPGGTNPVLGNGSTFGFALADGAEVRAVNVSGTTGAGITATGVTSATVGGTPGGMTSVSDANGADINVSGGSAGTLTFNTNVSNTSGSSVQVSNRTGGTVEFNGSVTDTGSGVSLTNNTGTTINFNGVLTLNTGAQAAFSATGGGTVTAGAGPNTLTTTTGTALKVQNTNIGANGLDFRSISSNGAANGIVVQNTGNTAGLTVTGNSAGICGGSVTGAGNFISGPDLTDCTGGSILNSTGTGVLLSQTRAASITRMRISGSGGDGIGGTSLAGFMLSASTLTNNGNAAEENGIDLGDSAALAPQGVTGTVNILSSTVTGSADSNIIIQNSSGTANMLIDHSRIANADSAVGATQDNVHIEASGFATIGTFVNSNNMAAAKGDHVQINAANGAGGGGGTFTSAIVGNNRMTGGAVGALAQGITISAAGQSPLWAGSVKYNVSFNNIQGAVTHAVTISMGASGGNGSFNGTVQANTIGTTGQALSCSTQGNGIFHKAEGSGTSNIHILTNQIRRCFDRGIQLAARDGNGTLNATVTQNTVTEMSDTNNTTFTPREAFLMEAGSTSSNILGGVDDHKVCLGLSGNTLVGGAHKISDIRTRQRFQTKFLLPTYVGTPFDTAAVATELTGNNPGATATATANDDPITTTEGYYNTPGGAACPLPSL